MRIDQLHLRVRKIAAATAMVAIPTGLALGFAGPAFAAALTEPPVEDTISEPQHDPGDRVLLKINDEDRVWFPR